ncbi:MAG: thioredoxin [Planctomycetota bacterium]|nr:MAG: thioredoxin [Planctomycetota bacterium]
MDLARDLFTVRTTPDGPSEEELVRAVEELGYGAAARPGGAPPPSTSEPPGTRSGPLPPLVRAALARARAEHKLVLLDFSAKWCGPCQRMKKESFPSPEVATAIERFVLLEVDTDEHPEVAQHFGVRGIPDLRILDADGRELRRAIGFRSPAQLRDFLEGG